MNRRSADDDAGDAAAFAAFHEVLELGFIPRHIEVDGAIVLAVDDHALLSGLLSLFCLLMIVPYNM